MSRRDAITIVVPHRSARNALIRLLPLLEGWRHLVVDDSDDGLSVDAPTLRLGGGRGFAVAANRGLAAAGSEVAILLNDDAVPDPDCLDRLVSAGGLCGPVLTGPRGVESAGISLSTWGRVRQRIDAPAADRAVDALSGACLLMPGGARFDERFPHGFEDVELCRRLGGARLVAAARCWHEGGGTLHRRSPLATQHAVTGQALLFAPGWRTWTVAALHVAQVLREGGPAARMGAIAAGVAESRRRR
ncbi:MAG: glycosyltransferase family 2 protein [Myxococcales bacterium]|nr:glycosyltransferase family 2 protein [Myxococcales bacterium]